jgi:hypothetical protein
MPGGMKKDNGNARRAPDSKTTTIYISYHLVMINIAMENHHAINR